jgi:vacuolar-type H+-ATPase subunit I/STV1
MGFSEYNYAFYLGYALLVLSIVMMWAAVVSKIELLGVYALGVVFLPATAFLGLYYEYGDRSILINHVSFLVGCGITGYIALVIWLLCIGKESYHEY